MSKTKVSSKVDKKAPKALSKVKDAGVTKATSSPAAKSKDVARKVAAKESKASKKNKKKEPTPSSSESESDSDEDMKDASSSSESESEDEKPVKKESKKVEKKEESSSEESDSSDSESESEDEKPAPKKAAKKEESSDSESDSESESESEDEKPAAKKVTKKEETSESSDSSDSESEDEAPAKAEKAEKESSDDSESESGSDSSDSESEAEEKPSKKRKADEEPAAAAAKKTKTEAAPEGASTNLFVGNLSWNVDEEWLQREFAEFGELTGCRIVTDRESGRSRGFGYVEYADAADAAKAFEAKKGAEIDGRPINLDYAAGRQNKDQAGGRDRAQTRAKSFGDSTSPESDTLFVGNLPFSATEDALRDVFGEQGTILGIRLPTNPDDGRPKGFGYVQFSSVDEARSAHSQLQGVDVEGRPLRLDFSTPRPPREGGGGGFGGRGGGRGGNFGGRGGGRGGRGGFGARGGGQGGFNKARGGIPEFKGKKVTF